MKSEKQQTQQESDFVDEKINLKYRTPIRPEHDYVDPRKLVQSEPERKEQER